MLNHHVHSIFIGDPMIRLKEAVRNPGQDLGTGIIPVTGFNRVVDDVIHPPFWWAKLDECVPLSVPYNYSGYHKKRINMD